MLRNGRKRSKRHEFEGAMRDWMKDSITVRAIGHVASIVTDQTNEG